MFFLARWQKDILSGIQQLRTFFTVLVASESNEEDYLALRHSQDDLATNARYKKLLTELLDIGNHLANPSVCPTDDIVSELAMNMVLTLPLVTVVVVLTPPPLLPNIHVLPPLTRQMMMIHHLFISPKSVILHTEVSRQYEEELFPRAVDKAHCVKYWVMNEQFLCSLIPAGINIIATATVETVCKICTNVLCFLLRCAMSELVKDWCFQE